MMLHPTIKSLKPRPVSLLFAGNSQQIWPNPEMWPKISPGPDFPKNSRMPDLPELGPKSGTSLNVAVILSHINLETFQHRFVISVVELTALQKLLQNINCCY